MVEEEEEEVTIRISPDLEIIYATGGVGVGVDFDGIMLLPFTTTLKAGEWKGRAEPEAEAIIKHLIMLSPHAAKIVSDILVEAVKEYERRYGKIKMPELKPS